MATTMSAMRTCADLDLESRPLPAEPFVAVRYHFGMLLGVEDFEAEQAYHRGKNRLHNAWLHREGVAWGLAVTAPRVEGVYRGEIEVSRGLALDPVGNELHLDRPHCLDLSDWYEKKKEDRLLDESGEVIEADGVTRVKVAAWVSARFSSCLMRPVPALMEPCAGMGDDTAFSRAAETIDLRLEPGAPPVRAEPYHRLRLLFGLDTVAMDGASPKDADQRVLELLDGIAASVDAAQRRDRALAAFRECAALDVMDLEPSAGATGETPSARYPAEEPPIVLATIVARLRRAAGEERWLIEGDPVIDNTVRPAHVATRTLQELLCRTLLAGDTVEPPIGPASTGPRRAGRGRTRGVTAPRPAPQVDPRSVALERNTVRFDVSAPLAAASVTPDAVAVQAFGPDRGWVARSVKEASYDEENRRVTLTLGGRGPTDLLRIVVRGTGPTPVLGSNLIPLAGAVGDDPPAGAHEGRDFTHMLRARS